MNRFKPLLFVAALVGAVVVTALIVGRGPSAAGPAHVPAGSSPEATSRSPADGPAPEPYGTVKGSEPHTRLTLLRLRRSGPKVVSVTLSAKFEREGLLTWLPSFGESDSFYEATADAIRLVDEVNGREHFVLTDSDGRCLCSTGIPRLGSGETITVSAKFPAPPPDVQHASIQVPGFPSFDRVPIEP